MRCVECGHEIKDGAVFCIRCGAMQVSKDGNREAVGRTASAGSTGSRNVKTFEPTPKRGGGGVILHPSVFCGAAGEHEQQQRAHSG